MEVLPQHTDKTEYIIVKYIAIFLAIKDTLFESSYHENNSKNHGDIYPEIALVKLVMCLLLHLGWQSTIKTNKNGKQKRVFHITGQHCTWETSLKTHTRNTKQST